ncbi:HPr(Ser) kinase/phosphatase [Candidatus Chrysopegis kryptomonas]|uniref:HPr kinase/phosphorylase n=1 Tax=Candidatus Chryseopegocella kryptomonas TaxID=1633643 RepID=A0A0N7MWR5_9BACT|nr:HPr(Ser) kinase/phosphatase [Candidatus Chrysopegis kryptomonas]CUS99379.1 Hpr(Ser) kinase/phosphatase [Candidatus Chrysopegis kryptomonas]
MFNKELKEIRKSHITVGFFYEAGSELFKLKTLNGEVGFDRKITDKNIHRPGLALAGYVELFTYNRIQVFGNTEIRYLQSLTPENRIKSIQNILQFEIPCVVITNDNVLPDNLLDLFTEKKISVFQTPLETTKLVYFISDFLDDQFAPQTVVHGDLVDVYGIGLLFVGRSGIGKSEIALDLIERGHRLVADDVVLITKKGENILIGTCNTVTKHFMEIRGLGIIDVKNMFGIRAIRYQKRIEVVVELLDWDPKEEYTRTGLDEEKISILGVEIPLVKLPIFPGKNITVIAEVIALNHLLKHYGYDSAKEFNKNLETILKKKTSVLKEDFPIERITKYFEHDFE